MEQRLRPNTQRARRAITWLWVMVGAETLVLLANGRLLSSLQRMEHGEQPTEQGVILSEFAIALSGLIYLAAFVFAAITFIKWFRRAFYNLQRSTTGLQYTEDWAAAAWFIPVLNLFRPFQIMRELYMRTIALVGVPSTRTAHVGWWWTFWVITGVLGQVAFRLDMSAEEPSEIILSTQFAIAEGIFGIPAALLALTVVKRYAAMEPAVAALSASVPPNIGNEVSGSLARDSS